MRVHIGDFTSETPHRRLRIGDPGEESAVRRLFQQRRSPGALLPKTLPGGSQGIRSRKQSPPLLTDGCSTGSGHGIQRVPHEIPAARGNYDRPTGRARTGYRRMQQRETAPALRRVPFHSDPRPMTWLSSSNDRTPSTAETTKMAGALPTIYEKSQGGLGVLSAIAEVAPPERGHRRCGQGGDPQPRRPGRHGRVRHERRRGGRRCRFRFRPSRGVPVPSPPSP
jgi:hypothetical protein